MGIRPAVLNQNYGVDRDEITMRSPIRGLRREPVIRCQFGPNFRLKRCKFEIAIRVAFDNKINGGIAKIADPVEQNHRAHVLSLANRTYKTHGTYGSY